MTPYMNHEMNNANYWKKSNGGTLLINDIELNLINKDFLSSEECGMNDIFKPNFIEKKASNLKNSIITHDNVISALDKYHAVNEDSNYANTDLILSEALEIVSSSKLQDKDHRYAITIRDHITLHTIPFKKDIGANTILDFFNVTDIVSEETILVIYTSNSGNALYVYTVYGCGWITVNPSSDLKFLSYEEWLTFYSSKPYVKLSTDNILDVSFNHLDARYFWGSIYDCSGYVRHIYSHFGVFLPANTKNQKKIPCFKYDLSTMATYDKIAILNTLPIGAILYMEGHAAIFIGVNKGHYYVINSVGHYIDPFSKLYIAPERVMINSLDLLRANGKSWLENIDTISIPWLRHNHYEVK